MVQNGHDALIFIITSHGDTDQVIYDSNIETYDLQDIFSAFIPEYSSLIDSYEESKEETESLFEIPKIFLIDACRGDYKARATKILTKDAILPNSTKTTAKKSSINATKNGTNDNDSECKDIESEKIGVLNASKTESKTNDEKIVLKTLTNKNDTKKVFAQETNIYKLFANTEGCCVGDGSKNGGLFLRSV